MKLSERVVIVVRGSEDGTIGVYTNVSKAKQKAIKYLSGESGKIQWSLLQDGRLNTAEKGDVSVDFTYFLLNET